MQKIGIAIAGLGFGESVHLKALQTLEEFDIKALWHYEAKKVAEVANKYNIKGYSSWDELLENKDISAIIIATPPEPRFKLAKKALIARKHLLLEKPVALHTNEIKELQTLAIEKNLSVAVNFEYRMVPTFMQAKELLLNKSIGEPWLVKFDWIMSSRANKDRPWNWYSDKDQGGGVIGALGTHAIDILHWLIGPIEEANGSISTSIQKRKCNNSEEYKLVTSEDISLSHMKFSANYSGRNIPAQLSISSVSKSGRGCWIEIYGEDGTIILGSDNQKDYVHGFKLWHAPKGENLCPVPVNEKFQFDRTWEDGRIAPVRRLQTAWSKSIINKIPMIPGLYEGIESQKICEKIRKSNL